MRQIICITLLFFCSFTWAVNKSALTLKIGDNVIELSYQDILKLPSVEHTMKHIWADKKITYTGVKLSTILKKYNITGEWLKLTAINDYSVDVPTIDADKGAFIAYLSDGNKMKIRDKGPFWLLYPFGENKELDISTYHHRAIWQLMLIEASE
jgi:hypothetical protein